MPADIEVFRRLLVVPETRLKIPLGWVIGSYQSWHRDLPVPLVLGPERLVGTWSDDRWGIEPELRDLELQELRCSFEQMRALEFETTFPTAAKSLTQYWLRM